MQSIGTQVVSSLEPIVQLETLDINEVNQSENDVVEEDEVEEDDLM